MTINILAAQVGGLLKAHGLLLTTAESCTGGGVAHALTEIAGSSGWFERGFVTYSNLAKQQMLGVSAATVAQYGAVSEAVVREMVAGALANSQSQVALSVSGIAGPGGGMPDKPVGTVWFAWSEKNAGVIAQHYLLAGNRAEVRAQAVKICLQGVLDLLNHRIETA